jgi:hypothetical protein
MVGVTGFEPVTLRLSSACSNQLSYTPKSIQDFRLLLAVGRRAREDRQHRDKNRAIVSSQMQLVELRRFELLTFCLQSRRSTN